MMTESGEKEKLIDRALASEIAKEEGVAEISQEGKSKYLRQFSFGAFVFGPIYFIAMADWPLLAASIVGGIFFPIIFILPFFARANAWRRRKWISFGHFQQNQKAWDKAGVYSFALLAILYILASYFLIKYIEGLIPSGTDLNTLKDSVKTLQDLSSP
ncbi:MAG: hypothetical protein NTW50_03375 [Candidatus Berkelbacteria bacterium]|nr:hypothetical protein [Candidatus Berkelbacteria bacterium]